jgi:protein-S-isoprenylcysteine O-methyltransferase Ste14
MPPVIAIYIVWVTWFFVWWGLGLWWSRPAVHHVGWQRELIFRIPAAAGYFLMFGLYPNSYDLRHPLWDKPDGPVSWLLIAVAVAGFGFSLWARVAMKHLWAGAIVRKHDHHIVDSGPYAYVRHPIYLGTAIAAFATASILAIPSAMCGAGLIVLALIVKAKMEENFLCDEMNGAYEDYAACVPMLIPFVGRLRR